MYEYLIEIDNKARALFLEEKYNEALPLFIRIVDEYPDYEHGSAYYDVASCYEELEEYGEAEKNYLKALAYEPDNVVRLGGLASCYYISEEYEKALVYYIALLSVEIKCKAHDFMVPNTIIGLKSIIEKLNMSKSEFKDYLKKENCEELFGKVFPE